MATDFLDEKRREIHARLKELKPLVDEYHRLSAATDALEGMHGSPSARTRPGRTRGAAHAGAPAGRGRPKGSGKRADESLALVKANPGITIPEIAQHMGIKQNYLYRVLPGLEDDGLVRREGRGWYPAGD